MRRSTPLFRRSATATAAAMLLALWTAAPAAAQQCNCSCDALIEEQLPNLDVQQALLNESGINASTYVGATVTTPVKHSTRFDGVGGMSITHLCIQLKKSSAGAGEPGVIEISHPDASNNGLPGVPFFSQPFVIDPVIPALGTRPHQIVGLNSPAPAGGSFWVTVGYLDAQGGIGHQGVRPRLSGDAAVWQGNTGAWEHYDQTGHNDYVGNTPVIRPLSLAPAPVTCPGTGILEGEPDCGVDSGGSPADTVNGGCNSVPPVFGSLICGDTVCGTSVLTDASGNLVRDTDWYEIAVSSPQTIRWSVYAEFDPQISILQPGPPDDPCNPTVLHSVSGQAFQTTVAEAPVLPGTYWLIVAPDFAQSPFSCGRRYTASALCCMVACPPGSVVESEACGQDTNGGCTTGTGFQTVQCDSIVCGELFTDPSGLDEDWYELFIPDPTGSGMAFVTLTIDAELPVALELHDDQCASPFPLIWNAIVTGACEQGTLWAGVPAPATFHIRVAPDPGVLGGHPCGTANRYRLSIDVGGNCGCQSSEYCNGGSACPQGNANDGSAGIAGCANSVSAGGATLRVSGGACGPQTRLLGSGLVPGTFGLYFRADEQVNGGQGLPFGDGLHCAGVNIVRLEVQVANAAGESSTTVDIFQPGGWAPGSIQRYQLWYRDSAGTAGFNLTNGVEVY